LKVSTVFFVVEPVFCSDLRHGFGRGKGRYHCLISNLVMYNFAVDAENKFTLASPI